MAATITILLIAIIAPVVKANASMLVENAFTILAADPLDLIPSIAQLAAVVIVHHAEVNATNATTILAVGEEMQELAKEARKILLKIKEVFYSLMLKK